MLVTHKNPRHTNLLIVLLSNSTFGYYLLKHSEENYLQYVHVLTFWFMLRWLFVQPCKTNIAVWRTSLISTPQIMNGKCSQWTVPKYSEDWERNTGEVFYDFSYLRNCLFCYQGRKVFSAAYQLSNRPGYINKYKNNKRQEEEISAQLCDCISLCLHMPWGVSILLGIKGVSEE